KHMTRQVEDGEGCAWSNGCKEEVVIRRVRVKRDGRCLVRMLLNGQEERVGMHCARGVPIKYIAYEVSTGSCDDPIPDLFNKPDPLAERGAQPPISICLHEDRTILIARAEQVGIRCHIECRPHR